MNGLGGGRFRFRTVGVVCVKAKSSVLFTKLQLPSAASEYLEIGPFMVGIDAKDATLGSRMSSTSSIHCRS
jgi:hypothetical protein